MDTTADRMQAALAEVARQIGGSQTDARSLLAQEAAATGRAIEEVADDVLAGEVRFEAERS